jgi:uncharacterized membrane protein
MERAYALTDGVFAIALTLLVVEIQVPEIPHDLVGTALWNALLEITPGILSYASSAAMIGLYWISHHRIFDHITNYDHTLLWLNILFLICVAFLPFPSALLGRYGHANDAVAIYGISLLVTGVMLNLVWWYAIRHNFVHEHASQRQIARNTLIVMLAPFVFLISVGVSLFHGEIASYSWIIVGVIYFVLSWLYESSGRGKKSGSTTLL